MHALFSFDIFVTSFTIHRLYEIQGYSKYITEKAKRRKNRYDRCTDRFYLPSFPEYVDRDRPVEKKTV